MATFKIELPESMREIVENRVAEGGYADASEYLRDLVRRDERRKAEERIDALIIEGFQSGPSFEIDEEFWARKHAEIDAMMARKSGEG